MGREDSVDSTVHVYYGELCLFDEAFHSTDRRIAKSATMNGVLFVLLSLLRGVTESEALNVSIFLLEVLTDLSRWNELKELYEEFCMSSPCFAKDYVKPDDVRVAFDSYQKVGQRRGSDGVVVQALDEADHGDHRVGSAVHGFASRAKRAGFPATHEQRISKAVRQC